MESFFDGRRHCAVITGASSGIGAEFARRFGRMGYRLILTGRNEEALKRLKKEIGAKDAEIIAADLSDTRSCIDFFFKARKFEPDILINNAGIGVYGEFTDTSLTKELEMIDVNVKAMHILFKLFLKDFAKKDRGYILNVASSAGFMAGPLMSTYYSTKSYVIRQTQAVWEELRRKGSKVRVSVLCPGPVNTSFNSRAGITGSMKGISAEECVEYTLRKMRNNRLMIIPTFKMQAISAAAKIAPVGLTCLGCYLVQKGKKPIE